MKYIIAIDVGTSSMRALLYRSDGAIEVSYAYEYHTVFPKPGQVEQNPATWSRSVRHVLPKIGEYLREHGLKAEGIAVTSQRSSLIPVDEDGVPMYNAIMWQDKRTLEQCEVLHKEYGLKELYRKTGLRINPYFVLPKIMWVRKNMPGIYQTAHKFIGVQDYVVYLLTNEFVTDWSQACRTMLMNIETFQWDEELMAIAGITADRLPKLVAPGSVAGGLCSEMAALTGLPEGLPVVVSGGDQQNAAVGLGVVRPGMAEANTGTGSFVIAYADKPIFDEECRVLCQASAIAGKWVIEAGIFNTGAIYRWFKEQFCMDIIGRDSPYERMNAEAEAAGAGAHGVMMLPHFEGSAAPYWNPEAKGMFFNLSLGTKRADCFRAILEGISMEIADNLRLIRKAVGDLTEVSAAGGMTVSDLFCRIQASCYELPVTRRENAEASSLGAVVVAAAALGLYESTEAACEGMLPPASDTFVPDEKDVPVYRKLSAAKQVLYRALNESDTYPTFMNLFEE